MDEEILYLVGIQTKDGLYISDNIYDKDRYNFHSHVKQYRFDGKTPEESYHRDWFLIEKEPRVVEEIIPSKKINIRYELKEEYPESEKTPRIIPLDSHGYGYLDEDSKYYDVLGLYERKYDETEKQFNPVEFKINIIDSIDNFKPIKQEYNIQSTLLDRIMYHPILRTTRPCELTKKETYDIIRKYIKQNIDTDWARITSDYDFCFTVEKILQLDQPESYVVDIANIGRLGKRKRKSKYETRYRKHRKKIIFEIAPKPYQSYPVVEPFKGNDYDDLVKNIEEYLQSLIEEINKPLVDCPNCHGLGVIFDKES